jgi:hypothetical protein
MPVPMNPERSLAIPLAEWELQENEQETGEVESS